MDAIGASSNGSHGGIHVALTISEAIRRATAASLLQGNNYKSPWDFDPDSWHRTPGKSVTHICQAPSQLWDGSSTGTSWSAATTPQLTAISELQNLVFVPNSPAASRRNAVLTPNVDLESPMRKTTEAFFRDSGAPGLSNNSSVHSALRRVPSMQDLRTHYIDEAKSVNVSGLELTPPSPPFRLANATPSSYIGHEQYSARSTTNNMPKASFCMVSPSDFVDGEPSLHVGNQECSSRDCDHEHGPESGFDPNLRSTFDWSSDEEDENEERFKWRIWRFKEMLLPLRYVRGK